MAATARQLKAELARNLAIHFFEGEEIENIMADLDSFERPVRRKALALAVFFSNVSSHAVPRALNFMKGAAGKLSAEDMDRWLGKAFDLLDSQGLEPAVRFLSKTDTASLRAFARPKGLELKAVVPRLQTFLRGISGMDLGIKPGKVSYTDCSSIYLPPEINLYWESERNFLLYKLAVAHKWGQIAGGTFRPRLMAKGEDGASAIEDLFEGFDDRRLAIDIYNVLEAERLEPFLKRHVPGLMKDAAFLKKNLLATRPSPERTSEKTALVEALYRHYLKQKNDIPAAGVLRDAVKAVRNYKRRAWPHEGALRDLYRMARGLEGSYEPVEPVVFLGTIRPRKVSERLAAEQRRLRGAIERILRLPDTEIRIGRRPGKPPPPLREPKPERKYLILKGRLIELDERTEELLTGEDELPGILMDGSDLGGRQRYVELRGLMEEEEQVEDEAPEGGLKYDEWDYKRESYRKGWCTLREYDVHPEREPFAEMTLRKYSGYVVILRKKFELLRTEVRVLRRQKEGEDIDIDAVVEAHSDITAGLSPGENMFARLDRQERNMAALFLLDMSGSTKGWVNVAEKEALVLMCEALEALGDRYAIYGFSGMTRNRCDFYRIKTFGEAYAEDVKRRIAGIRPKDYTRMGPPIRHSTNILKSVEARTKLLITLSDGKPEDYDAYKGDYGIEDTRKALMEAKQQAIHSYCITIDTEGGLYLPHMYGEVNYTVIDDVRKLPDRITEIYRRLTT